MGIASGSSLWVQVNGGEARELTVAEGAFGFRRLGGDGHFNADIPIAALSPGENRIELTAKGRGAAVSGFLSLTYDPDGSCPLPFTATWSELDHPQDAGQIVDGKWSLDEGGLRSEQLAYDRLFLLGNRSWRDYRRPHDVDDPRGCAGDGPEERRAGCRLHPSLRRPYGGHAPVPRRPAEVGLPAVRCDRVAAMVGRGGRRHRRCASSTAATATRARTVRRLRASRPVRRTRRARAARPPPMTRAHRRTGSRSGQPGLWSPLRGTWRWRKPRTQRYGRAASPSSLTMRP